MNYKTDSGAYEVLYPRTTTGNVTDFASYMGNYYTKSQSDSKYATTSWVQSNYYTQSQTNSQINSIVSSQIGSFEDNVVEPIGTIKCTSRTDLGSDWLLCNGQSFSSSDYPGLASLLPASATSAWQLVGSDKCPIDGKVFEVNGKYVRLSIGSSTCTVYYSDTYGLNSSWSTSTIGNYPRVQTGTSYTTIEPPIEDIIYNTYDGNYYIPLLGFNVESYVASGFAKSSDLKKWTYVSGATYSSGFDSRDWQNKGGYIGTTYNSASLVIRCEGIEITRVISNNRWSMQEVNYTNIGVINNYTVYGKYYNRDNYQYQFGYTDGSQDYSDILIDYITSLNDVRGIVYFIDETQTLGFGYYYPSGGREQYNYIYEIEVGDTQATEVNETRKKELITGKVYKMGNNYYYLTVYDSKIRVASSLTSSPQYSSTGAEQLIIGSDGPLYARSGNNLYVLPGGVVPNISGGSNYKYYIKGR